MCSYLIRRTFLNLISPKDTTCVHPFLILHLEAWRESPSFMLTGEQSYSGVIIFCKEIFTRLIFQNSFDILIILNENLCSNHRYLCYILRCINPKDSLQFGMSRFVGAGCWTCCVHVDTQHYCSYAWLIWMLIYRNTSM